MTIKEIQALINEGLASGEFTREEVQGLSDGVHSFADLYNSRMIWNALAFQLIDYVGGTAYKSKLHNDGGSVDGMFIVGAMTLYGQVTQHYPMDQWDVFRIPEIERLPWQFDGHGKKDVFFRLSELIYKIHLQKEMTSHAEESDPEAPA